LNGETEDLDDDEAYPEDEENPYADAQALRMWAIEETNKQFGIEDRDIPRRIQMADAFVRFVIGGKTDG
jgi:hypothetical protein